MPIKAQLHGENCLYAMSERGTICRLSFGYDDQPLCEVLFYARDHWPADIVAEHNRVTGHRISGDYAHG
jgi:hypothetical protein